MFKFIKMSYFDLFLFQTTVYIKCRNEIPKELFELVMGQFNNLNYVHLNDGILDYIKVKS